MVRREKKRRSYNLSKIRRSSTYSVQEIATLFKLHVNTVLRWIANGMPLIDDTRPYVVHGSDLHEFLSQRQAIKKRPCSAGELYCFACRTPRQPRAGSIHIAHKRAKTLMIAGNCDRCGTKMHRTGSTARLADYREEFLSIREERLEGPADPIDRCDFMEVIENA